MLVGMLAATLPAGRGTDDDGVHPPGDMVELRSDGSVPLVLLTARAGIDVRTTYVLLVPVVVEVEKAIVLTCTVDPAVPLAVAVRVKGVTGVVAGQVPVAAATGPAGVLPGIDRDGVLAAYQQGGFSSLANLGDLQVTSDRLAGILSRGAFERLNASGSLSGLLAGFTNGSGGLLGGLRELGAPQAGLVVAVAGVAVAVLAARTRRGVARG